MMSGFATAGLLYWVFGNPRYLEPFRMLIIRQYGLWIVLAVAAIWFSIFGVLYCIFGDDRKSDGKRLADINQRFKSGELPIRREQ